MGSNSVDATVELQRNAEMRVAVCRGEGLHGNIDCNSGQLLANVLVLVSAGDLSKSII